MRAEAMEKAAAEAAQAAAQVHPAPTRLVITQKTRWPTIEPPRAPLDDPRQWGQAYTARQVTAADATPETALARLAALAAHPAVVLQALAVAPSGDPQDCLLIVPRGAARDVLGRPRQAEVLPVPHAHGETVPVRDPAAVYGLSWRGRHPVPGGAAQQQQDEDDARARSVQERVAVQRAREDTGDSASRQQDGAEQREGSAGGAQAMHSAADSSEQRAGTEGDAAAIVSQLQGRAESQEEQEQQQDGERGVSSQAPRVPLPRLDYETGSALAGLLTAWDSPLHASESTTYRATTAAVAATATNTALGRSPLSRGAVSVRQRNRGAVSSQQNASGSRLSGFPLPPRQDLHGIAAAAGRPATSPGRTAMGVSRGGAATGAAFPPGIATNSTLTQGTVAPNAAFTQAMSPNAAFTQALAPNDALTQGVAQAGAFTQGVAAAAAAALDATNVVEDVTQSPSDVAAREQRRRLASKRKQWLLE